jgi:hypothetical protein
MKMDAESSTETSVTNQLTPQHISKDLNPPCENLKSQASVPVFSANKATKLV